MTTYHQGDLVAHVIGATRDIIQHDVSPRGVVSRDKPERLDDCNAGDVAGGTVGHCAVTDWRTRPRGTRVLYWRHLMSPRPGRPALGGECDPHTHQCPILPLSVESSESF